MADDIKSLDQLKTAVAGTPAEAPAAAAAVVREPKRDAQGRSDASRCHHQQ